MSIRSPWSTLTNEAILNYFEKNRCHGSFTLKESDSDSNLMTTLYYADYVHIAQTQAWIPISA